MKNVGKKLEKSWKKLEKGWKKLEKSWKKIHFFLTRADDLPIKPSRKGPALEICLFLPDSVFVSINMLVST